jgi:hypothetical protein
MEFVTSFPLRGNGTDFREFGYTGSNDDISGCWIAVTICVSGARHNIYIYISRRNNKISLFHFGQSIFGAVQDRRLQGDYIRVKSCSGRTENRGISTDMSHQIPACFDLLEELSEDVLDLTGYTQGTYNRGSTVRARRRVVLST